MSELDGGQLHDAGSDLPGGPSNLGGDPADALKTKANIGYIRALGADGVLSLNPSLVIAAEGAGPPDALRLIEQAGFSKGHTHGAAGISSRHTLALINQGGATAADIMALAEEIRTGVEARFGVELEMEPVRLGFTEDSAPVAG